MQSPITYETRAAKPSRIEESSTIRGKLTGPAEGVAGDAEGLDVDLLNDSKFNVGRYG